MSCKESKYFDEVCDDDIQEWKKKYRKAQLKYHPDKQPANKRKEAEEFMKSLNQCHEELKKKRDFNSRYTCKEFRGGSVYSRPQTWRSSDLSDYRNEIIEAIYSAFRTFDDELERIYEMHEKKISTMREKTLLNKYFDDFVKKNYKEEKMFIKAAEEMVHRPQLDSLLQALTRKILVIQEEIEEFRDQSFTDSYPKKKDSSATYSLSSSYEEFFPKRSSPKRTSSKKKASPKRPSQRASKRRSPSKRASPKRPSQRASPKRASKRASPKRAPKRASPKRSPSKRTSSKKKSPLKKRASTKRASPCPPGKVRNPDTGRCVSKSGKIGKKILEEESDDIPIARRPKRTSKRSASKKRSPSKKRASARRAPKRASSKKRASPCPSGKVRNPKTGRCVSKTGKIGKSILSKK